MSVRIRCPIELQWQLRLPMKNLLSSFACSSSVSSAYSVVKKPAGLCMRSITRQVSKSDSPQRAQSSQRLTT